MFSLYINFYKDIFIGLENIVKSDNQDFILSSDKDRILIEFNKLNARFKSYFLWLKVLFFLSCFSLIAVMLGIYLSYDLEQAICKIILLDFLRWINNVTILSFITLLFSYLFLIIPYYRNLHDITILTRVRP